MSRSENEGVVDTNLAVHGIDGLHVLSTSVFPTGASANPTMTLLLLALRLANHLGQALAQSD
jgi:choline dehydrogenase-like flavoprotein